MCHADKLKAIYHTIKNNYIMYKEIYFMQTVS
jgi:hypothetical protein